MRVDGCFPDDLATGFSATTIGPGGGRLQPPGVRRALPIADPVKMSVELSLPLAFDGAAWVVLRRVADLLAREVDVDGAVNMACSRDPFRRDDHVRARPPVSGIHDQVADRPRFFVDEEVDHVSEVSVAGMNAVAGHLGRAAQVGLSLGFRRTVSSRATADGSSLSAPSG